MEERVSVTEAAAVVVEAVEADADSVAEEVDVAEVPALPRREPFKILLAKRKRSMILIRWFKILFLYTAIPPLLTRLFLNDIISLNVPNTLK